MDHTHPYPAPSPSLQGETSTRGVRVRQGVPTQLVLPAPGTAHSPGTCVVGPGSSFEEQLSSGPALHPSLPACSSGSQPREAPAEGRGPAILTAGPNTHQCPNLPTNQILTTQGTDLRPRARGTRGDGTEGPKPPPHEARLPFALHSRAQVKASYPGPRLPAVGCPSPGSPGSATAEHSLEWEL